MPANIFEPTANGYAGRVRLFGIDEAIVLVAIEPGDGENTPAFRIQLDDEDGPEIGGAWKRVGERAGDYIALEIDSPLFPALFRPALFHADDEGAPSGSHGSGHGRARIGADRCAFPSSLCSREIRLIPSSRSGAGRPAPAAQVGGGPRPALAPCP